MSARILVTGPTGFVGRHTLQALQHLGYEVHALIHERKLAITNVSCHYGDLFDRNSIDHVMKNLKPTHLLHSAWVTAHGEFWQSSQNQLWLDSSINLIESFVANGGQRILALGSCAEYDWQRNDKHKWQETDPCVPLTVYGQKKLELANWLAKFSQMNNISYVWARLFFLFGKDENSARLIPYLIAAALNNQSAFCTTGLQIRDFIDTATCGSLLAEVIHSEFIGVMNVASGQGYSIQEIAKMIIKIVEHPVDYQFGTIPSRFDEPDFIVADIAKLQNVSPWIKQFDLELALREIISNVIAKTTHQN